MRDHNGRGIMKGNHPGPNPGMDVFSPRSNPESHGTCL
jgi:hypothetical protein